MNYFQTTLNQGPRNVVFWVYLSVPTTDLCAADNDRLNRIGVRVIVLTTINFQQTRPYWMFYMIRSYR